ncbi:hypothetical protein BFJ63_vAg9413 [Fusarium oxysporum f. sp. narcissi]|uniref:Uncharacterized protein n=1 Tax=Fusarium oxysporum f. sp. narcissi TaxID=451672 RepID=A0A4Q2VMS4_FUSOX|nr:hypothetical protein BFJ63_vAg9413 [Fusarium oxysporum f. sp. narcissi]
MAEILGLASSIITIVEVAGKLGTNTIRLKRLWDEVQDVPVSIQRCIEQLEILAPAIDEMESEFEKTRNMIQNDAATKRSLEYSRKAVRTLDTLVRDMEFQISAARTSRRLVAQLKVRIKKDVIEDHKQRLTLALQLLSLSQQTYLIALSRAQPEIIISEIRNWRHSDSQKRPSLGPEDDNQSTEGEGPGEKHDAGSPHPNKSPVPRDFSLRSTKKSLPHRRPGLLGSFTFQSYEADENPSIHHIPEKARYFQARIHMPWFIQRFWDFSVLRASTGWTFQLNAWNIRPWDTKIFYAIAQGQVEYIVDALKNKEASIYDATPHGNSLLGLALQSQEIESIKALISMGMRVSDVDPAVIFCRIRTWFWTEPETSSSMELARIWLAEMGRMGQQHCEMYISFLPAFWVVPNLHTILCEPESVRQVTNSFIWGYLNPTVMLELLKSGLAVPSDFPPCRCTMIWTGICDCYDTNFFYQYFHALLNKDQSFSDWRCLARKVFLGVPPLNIVHPHEGAFSSLTSILEGLWGRQFPLLPFERWIQNATTLWLEDLAEAKIDLEEYMSLEVLYSRECHMDCSGKHTEVEIQPGTRLPEFGPSLVILSVGPRADDWSFSWDPCVEELSGEFWTTLDNAQVKVPGAWVDERNEDFECLMGDRELCRFRRWEKYNKQIKMGNMVIKGIGKDNYKQNTRLPAPEWPERKDRERLQVRGMTTCEEFSPYKPPNWF